MARKSTQIVSRAAAEASPAAGAETPERTYTFESFFHPFTGELIAQVNEKSLPGLFEPKFHEDLARNSEGFFQQHYTEVPNSLIKIDTPKRKEIDLSDGGPYSVYNWELLFHFPLALAVHLSKNQRFAEAQKWFHFIFNPTTDEEPGAGKPPGQRFWKFLRFRQESGAQQIGALLALLSRPEEECTPAELKQRERILAGYEAIKNKPFQPHVVARTRILAYQYNVVMKYLDNLIAWGDSLFMQDTIESINEATQRYVLAANLLGPRPQRIPSPGAVQSKTFAQLKAQGMDPMGNALVELETNLFPFNQALPQTRGSSAEAQSRAYFGIGRTLYFCVPRNEKLLSYWDTVADRLFKVRNCMNIQGIFRQLALFEPPIDPGMLVKAAAAGINIGGVAGGLNQPIGPVRSLFLIQKALELCGEVRGLGNSLLSALEKRDGERLALLRQKHEIKIQELSREVRFLQWKQAQEATESLLRSRASALERYKFYQRLLGLQTDGNAPEALPLNRRALTEENFDEAHGALVGQYDKALAVQPFPKLRLAGGTSPANQSGAAGQGNLYLNVNENADLNVHSRAAANYQLMAWELKQAAPVLGMIPQFPINLHFMGIGGTVEFGGIQLAKFAQFSADLMDLLASRENQNAATASKTASYERRADDWLLQHNLAARELMQIGRQILSSLIAEQVAHHEYLNIQKQIENSQEVDRFLHEKYTNEELYGWMQGEISRLYYEYFRFAFDTARRAERTMKHELMRPEVEATDYVKFNYWDGGRKGLLAGEALYLDVKRMELAFHDNNKREMEMTRHVSLRQLDPLALLALKTTGRCEVTIPEWLLDRDCPGLYMRRIKSVALSIPAVAGPYTSVNCTLTLLRSSVRKSPLLKDGEYKRQGANDDRFVDYLGQVQSIVTSSGANDSGMFETNLRDERFLHFEGAGAESTWRLELPKDFPSFDYTTISDVVLHLRYTARQGVDTAKIKAALDEMFAPTQSTFALLFSLPNDFAGEWSAFVNGTGNFTATICKDHFPYFTQGKAITIASLELYAQNVAKHHAVGDPAAATTSLSAQGQITLSLPPDAAGPNQVLTRTANAQTFLVVRYGVG